MQTSDEIDTLLNRFKEGRYDPEDPDQRAEFVQDVQMEEGLYPISALHGEGAMRDSLSAQTVVERTYTVQSGDTLSTIARQHDMTTTELRNLNPAVANTDAIQIGDQLVVQRAQTFLQVKVVKTVTYTETVDYKTKIVYRDDQDTDYRRITTYGREGTRKVTAEDTYVDGVKTGRKVIKKTVTKQPVTQIIEQGTKKIPSGQLLWPVPICHNMSRGYYRGHYAIDICNGPVPVFGHDAVAADVGTVIQAATGWNGGYGVKVVVDHGNGVKTVYAHCQSLYVKVGDRVTSGQVIATMGNTGRSTGPHLHFEININGTAVNPSIYLGNR
jgi:murein DD-endopeptidase MepM/ murein hydrolase activator NlpD